MQETINLVSYGVDTLIINVRYSDSKGQPVKQELDEKLVQELDYLQSEARRVETAEFGCAADCLTSLVMAPPKLRFVRSLVVFSLPAHVAEPFAARRQSARTLVALD